MTTTIDEEKSQARAVLRFAASELSSRRAVEGYAAAIMSGEEGFMDHVCNILDAIHVLREELSAWEEGHEVHDARCKSRYLLAWVGEMFDEPSGSPELVDEEIYNQLDLFRHYYLQGDPEASELICELVQAIFGLRENLIAWGASDLCPWERSGDRGPLMKEKQT